jgi:putative ABC transport system permease protein
MQMPSTGAIFGSTLRKRLHLEVGDLVELWIPEQFSKEESSRRYVRVAGFNQEAIGTVAYMRQSELGRLFRKDMELPPNAVSGAIVMVQPKFHNEVRDRLYDVPYAGSVLSVPEIKKLVQTMMQTMRTFVWIMELFGVALAFAMVFNMVSINILERSSEVATLRTIGISRSQISLMIGAENMIVAFIGAVLGLPIGRWFVEQFWKASQTEEQQDLFTFTIVVLPETYVIAGVAVLVTALVSQWPSLRMLAKLNLAQATKERSS